MSKEYMQALDDLFDLVTCQESFEKAQKCFDVIEPALERLKDIEDAEDDVIENALKELDEIVEYISEDKRVKYKSTILFDCEIIKDALLKAKEQKAKYNKQKEILDIIKASPFILQRIFENKGLKTQENFDKKYFWGTITEDKVKIVEEWLDE